MLDRTPKTVQYSPYSKFTTGDILVHYKFGYCLITHSNDSFIEIKHRDGTTIKLVHNRLVDDIQKIKYRSKTVTVRKSRSKSKPKQTTRTPSKPSTTTATSTDATRQEVEKIAAKQRSQKARRAKDKGAENERFVFEHFENMGFSCTKSAGSLGLFDIIAFRKKPPESKSPFDLLLVQVKSNNAPTSGSKEMLDLKSFTNYPDNGIKILAIVKDGTVGKNAKPKTLELSIITD